MQGPAHWLGTPPVPTWAEGKGIDNSSVERVEMMVDEKPDMS